MSTAVDLLTMLALVIIFNVVTFAVLSTFIPGLWVLLVTLPLAGIFGWYIGKFFGRRAVNRAYRR